MVSIFICIHFTNFRIEPMAKKKKSAGVKSAKKQKATKKSGGVKASAAKKKKQKPVKKAPVTKSAHRPAKAKPKSKKALQMPVHKPVSAKKQSHKSIGKKAAIVSKPSPAAKKPSTSIAAKIKNGVKKIVAAVKPPASQSNGKSTQGKSVAAQKPAAPSTKKVEANAPAQTTAPSKSSKAESNAASPTKVKIDEKFKSIAANALKRIPPEKRTGVLAINNAVTKGKNELSPSKIASISYSITNPARKTDSYAIRPEKEPQGKFELEFVVHASAEMLYEFISTPSGLSEWFCDDLNIRNGIYTFIWDDQLQQARLLKTVDQQLVRFQWVDKTDGSYFEFRIQRDDLTNDISLIITDFAETVAERESSKLLWHSQVEKLMHVLGSIF